MIRRIFPSRCFGVLALFLLVIAGCSQRASVDALIFNAKETQAKHDHKAAIILFRNVIQQSPNNQEAHFLLGLSYNETDDPRSAEKEFRRAVELKKDAALVKPHLVKALLLQGEFGKVLNETRPRLQKADEQTAELLSARGIAQLSLGAADEAKASFEKALVSSPEFPDALLGQARLAVIAQDMPGAAGLVERALQKSPQHLDALLVRGDLQRLLNNNEAALAAYRKVTEYYPENVRARLNMASIYLATARYDEVLRQVEAVRKIAPQSPMGDYLQALAEFRQREYGKAKALVERVFTVTSEHIPSRLLAGAIEQAQGNYAQAEPHLRYVVGRAPGNLYARKLLADGYLRSRQAARAIPVLLPALEQAPEDVGLLSMIADSYLQNGEFAKAIASYEKAARIDPKNVQARTGLGLSRLAAGEGDRAIVDLESAVGLDADKYQADILQVMVALVRGDYEGAERALSALEKKQAANSLTYNFKAVIFAGKKKYPEARLALEKALALEPRFFPAIANMVQLDLQENNPQAARKRLDLLLQKDPNNVQVLLLLASLDKQIGANPEEVIAWLGRAKQANPGSVQPVLMLARRYLAGGEPRKAVDFAKEAQAVSPDSAEVVETLGDAQMAVGERNAAVTSFSKLVALQPESPIALVKLAEAQVANENAPAATFSLKKALAIKPDFIDAQSALAILEARAGRLNEAMRIVTQVRSQMPKASRGIMLEGDVRMVEQKYAQAAAAYEKALAINRSGDGFIKLHKALALSGHVDEADSKLLSWLKEHPEDMTVHYYLADFSLKTKSPRIAVNQYQFIVQRDPQSSLALNNLAWAYHQAKDTRALPAAEQAYVIANDNPLVMDTYGWMLIHYGSLEKGIDLLQRASSLAPNQQEIRYHYAAGLVKAGKEEAARLELERVLASGVTFQEQAEASELLKQLR